MGTASMGRGAVLAAFFAASLGQAAERNPAGDWSSFGGDPGQARYSGLKQINARSVARLGGAWRVSLEEGTSKAAPVVQDGVMYVTSTKAVYALDAATGAVKWRHQPDKGLSYNTKGVAVGGGAVYVPLGDTRVLALDAASGAVRWSNAVAAELQAKFMTAAPAYADGLVIQPVSGGDIGALGRIVALDAATGEERWRFVVIPGPGEPGHETWPQGSDIWKHGGGAVWMTPSIDRELGLAIIGIGNAAPQYGGEARPGDNLYSSTAVALDLKTGALRWHYQVVHHDMWDADLGTPLVLYDDQRGGRITKAVAVMRTDGVLFQLDRATGKPIVPVEERVVKQNRRLFTSRTQPYPVGVEPIGRQCVDPAMIPAGFSAGCFFDPVDVDQVNVMLPFATARSAPMAYDPSTNRFYVAGGVSAVWHRRGEDPGYYALARVPGIQSYGLIAAIDASTGRIAWQNRLPYLAYDGSGVSATAGGLVFHGDPDGTLQAYDAQKGALLWKFQTGAAAEGPVAVYAVKGEQMVALAATNAVWAFRLGGTLEQAPPPAPRPTVTAFAGRVVATDKITLSAETGDTLAALGIPGASHKRQDEFATSPVRAKVKAGAAITFVNEGTQSHELAAADGSWTTGPLAPGKSIQLRFDKPGSQTYVCKDHPWTIGEIVVE